MKARSSESGDEMGVQMAPLIDCVFLLLIYFLCTAHVTKPHRDLEINLPEASVAEQTKSSYDTVIIEVTKDGRIYMDAQEMTTRLLHQKLQQKVAEKPDRRVRLDVDRSCSFYYLNPLIDLLQFVGLNNVGLRATD